MGNMSEALIVEENFFDVLLTKKNCIDIELEILKFINNRNDNQFLTIDISTSHFKDNTILLYLELLEDGTRNIYDAKEMN